MGQIEKKAEIMIVSRDTSPAARSNPGRPRKLMNALVITASISHCLHLKMAHTALKLSRSLWLFSEMPSDGSKALSLPKRGRKSDGDIDSAIQSSPTGATDEASRGFIIPVVRSHSTAYPVVVIYALIAIAMATSAVMIRSS
jgi:hypothetical protein